MQRITIVTLSALLMLGFGLWIVVDLDFSQRQRLEGARKELDNLSITIERNIGATLSKIDVAISDTAYDYSPILSGTAPLNADKANRDLLRRMAYIPEAQEHSLRIVNTAGKVVFNAGGTAELPDVSLADRPYFVRQQNEPFAGLVMSEAMLSRITGTWLLTLSRRISDADGRFLGVVQAALPAEYFQTLFELLRIGPNDSIALLDENKRLLARHPPQPAALGKQVTQLSILADLPKGDQAASYRNGVGVDNVERFFVVRHVEHSPYLLVIGRSADEIAEQQRSQSYLYSAFYLALVVAFAYLLRVYFGQQRESEKLATTDSLTGLKNRRALDAALEFSINLRSRSRTSPKPLSVALFDVDHFKEINDTQGHLRGDEVLQRVVQVIKRRIRKSDLPCRWGGEEFIVLFDDCDVAHAASIADSIRSAVQETPISDPDDGMRITISAGVAEFADGDDVDSLIMRADQSLYRAKNSGRNRVCQSLPPPPSATADARDRREIP